LFGKLGPTWSKFRPERKNVIVSHLDKGPNGLFCERLLFCMYILLNMKTEIIRTVILSVVLHGCENRKFTNFYIRHYVFINYYLLAIIKSKIYKLM
jgi:hypothetical protein